MFGGLTKVIDLRSRASTAFIKTRRELEWKACEEKPRSISATANNCSQYCVSYSCEIIRRTLYLGSPDTSRDVDGDREGMIEGNIRRHIAEHGAHDTHVRWVEILCAEFTVRNNFEQGVR